jgi:hypothetical protein
MSDALLDPTYPEGTGAPAWAGAKRLPGGRQALTVLAHGRGERRRGGAPIADGDA